jgi:glutamate-ammonia-ligase adenylyltransferase
LTPDFWAFAAELTDLAELVVGAALERVLAEVVGQFGQPRLPDGSLCPLAVLALGKCGGRELGFASDIELIFVYGGKGVTDGPRPVSTGEFFNALVSTFVAAIWARQEGIFQVDLQLRPYGKAGSLAVALDAFQRYYAPDGPAWAYERQALVKMRLVAGDEALGRQVCALRDEYVYGSGESFDVTAMRAMRERQVRHLVAGGTFNAKFSPGGLVDVEYLIQALQITHGAQDPSLRSTNLRQAMLALHQRGLLSEDDYARLRKAHTFLRWLIDSLRVVRGNAKDVTVPPYGSEEYAFLARRLLYGSDVDRLRDDLQRYPADVQELNQRLLT